ncbi:MAG: hypothetical protein QOD57_5070, partial [Actinomycetota bacterium]|nr:hypothetical protein [Actinomycetota bacterium]
MLKSWRDPAEITHMFFQITGLYFPARREHWLAPGTARAWDGVATPGEIGPPAAG